MRIHTIGAFSMLSVLLFFVAGNAQATPTERVERRYLKNRIKLRIDEDWKVQTGNQSGAEAVAFDDSGWATTNVPHDMSITLVSTTDSDPGAIGWYRKHFTLPPGFAGKTVIVQFDGVYQDSRIYLNGTEVGSQRFGYVSFCCDLTPYLHATGDNVLAVFVDNLTSRRSHFYSGTGIYRHVWLIATDMVHIKNWGTAVTTPKVAVAQSEISIRTEVVNELATPQTRDLETTIYDDAGNALQAVSTPFTVAAKSSNICAQTLSLSSCKLWSPATPVLYYAYSRILNNSAQADDYISPFGIRELKYSATGGFAINGVPAKLKGVCIHHTLVPAGAAVPDAMWERTIKELLASGCTSIRTSHNPQSPEFYDYCDRLGMMVMDEWCDKWSQTNAGSFYADFDQVWQKDLTSFIERDRNHPSVVIWSLGNEVAAAEKVPEYIPNTLKTLVPFARKLDYSRPYTHACVAGWHDAPGMVALAEVEDIVGVNYQDFLFDAMHAKNPDAVIIGTEQDPYSVPGSNVPTWYSVRDRPYVVGHHLWTGVDYLGESKHTLGGESGFLDNCIFRKSWFYYQQSQWSEAPMVHVTVGNGTGNGRAMPVLAENWNQSGPVDVVTYTNCESVDLYVNATKIGTQKSSDFARTGVMQWTKVPWHAGEIRAVGMNGGTVVATDTIRTVGSPAKLMLKPDRTTLEADGNDVSCVEVDVCDADNNSIITAGNPVQFTLTGPGRSVGIASSDWTSSEPFKATSRNAYKGKALIVVQSTLIPGTIGLTVTSPGLPPAVLSLKTNSPQAGVFPGASDAAKGGAGL
jgi:beta-galactosidase